MGLPSLNVIFQQLGSTAIERGTRGIAALLLKDTVPTINPIVMNTPDSIPKTLTAPNQEQLVLAFEGYTVPPKQVIAYVVPADTTDYTAAQKYLETIEWNYFAFPDIADTEVEAFKTWEKTLRDNLNKPVKAVLPNCAGDYEGIINFASSNLKGGGNTYTAKQYCARIAGLLASTPLKISATYAPLPELTDCDHLIKTDADAAIDAGKLIVINDGRKVKIARAINSLVTTTATKGSKFKKIKLIDIMDQAKYDISCTVEDSYIGKIDNTYDNKVLLISAIQVYFEQMELQGLLQKDTSKVYIDIPAQTAYLKSINYTTTDGKTVDQMTQQEIKEADTDEKVFIGASIKTIDAMEDISFSVAV
jgi:hypothetical protein